MEWGDHRAGWEDLEATHKVTLARYLQVNLLLKLALARMETVMAEPAQARTEEGHEVLEFACTKGFDVGCSV